MFHMRMYSMIRRDSNGVSINIVRKYIKIIIGQKSNVLVKTKTFKGINIRLQNYLRNYAVILLVSHIPFRCMYSR